MAKIKYKHPLAKLTPAQVLALFFFSVITTGAILLSLPIATQSGQSIGIVNAFFTSTSSACVTGLIAVDTGTTFALFGKVVIIVLIQIGGLGIMIFATVIYGFTKRQLSVSNMLIMQEALNKGDMFSLKESITNTAKLTFICESIGAFLLSFRFIPMYGAVKGAGYSVFHAISAFCNAGFDLNGNFNSLTGFANDPLVILTIAGLIITGGIGFAVIAELIHKQKNRRFTLHFKMALSMTAILLIVGTVVVFALEYSNPATLGNSDMSFGTKIMSAFFQSVTLRTAGFNSIDQGGLRTATKLIGCVIMFIGANPGSTGGGIKTTSFAIIILSVWALIRGNDEITVSNRRIKRRQVVNAVSIFIMGLMIVVCVTMLITIFEDGLILEDVLYEVFSAFGTVGITAGITTTLSNASKIVLMMTMFSGRLGPMTLAMAFAGTRSRKKPYRSVEEEVMIG